MARYYTLKITLLGVEPPIWRRVVVPGSIGLEALHRVIQLAMGWENAHLHQFLTRKGKRCYSDPQFGLDHADDELGVPLHRIAKRTGSTFIYNYDFGDDWKHQIEVESTTTAPGERPLLCVAGERACPPEDVGGPWSYQLALDAIADPEHERHEDFKEWMPADFDPERIDLDEINRQLNDPESMPLYGDQEGAEEEWFF
jgi:hypothetical protein